MSQEDHLILRVEAGVRILSRKLKEKASLVCRQELPEFYFVINRTEPSPGGSRPRSRLMGLPGDSGSLLL